MKLLTSILAFAALVCGQNPNSAIYPGGVASDTNLFVAANNASTTVTAPIGPADTTLNVSSTALFIAPTLVSIDNEIIAVCSKTSTTFGVCGSGRGYDRTSAASHAFGSLLAANVTSWYHNQVAAEIKSIETNALKNAANTVSLSNLVTIANNTVLGNISGGAASPSALTQAQLTALINTFSSSLSGAVPASGGGTTNFLRADGTWAAPGGGSPGGSTNDIQVNVSSAFTGGRGTLDSSQNIVLAGTGTFGNASGNAGSVDFPAGTVTTIGANSFGIGAGPSMTTSVRLQSPNAVPAAHQLMIMGAPSSNRSVWAYQTVPDCQDSGGNHLNFTQSSDTFTCGTSSSGGGGGAALTTASQGAWLPGYKIATNGTGTVVGGAQTSLTPFYQFVANTFSGGLKFSKADLWISLADTGKTACICLMDTSGNLITNGQSNSFSLSSTGDIQTTWTTPPTITGNFYFGVVTNSSTVEFATADGSTTEGIIVNNTGSSTTAQIFTGTAVGSVTCPSSVGTRAALTSFVNYSIAAHIKP